MADNLPKDFAEMEHESIVGEDSRSLQLTHYVLAERLMQVEYATIAEEMKTDPNSQTLIYILEGGFRGYHKFTSGELWAEWKDGAEDKWYELYESDSLPWGVYDEDPVIDLENDENGEVAKG